MKKSLLNIFLMLLSCTAANAQNAFFNSTTVDERDETMPVNTLYKDSRGYIWIGTRGGLYYFNGKTSRNILPDSLKNRLVVTTIEEDRENRLWFGCQSGYIGYIDKGILIPFSPEEGIPAKPITDLLFDRSGRLWFSTADEGIYVREGKILYNINADDGLPDNYVNTLQADQQDNIIAGTDRGLSLINIQKGKKKIHTFSSRNGLPDNIVRSVRPAEGTGKFWVGMEDKGLCLFEPATGNITVMPGTLPWRFGRINDLLARGNDIWIATEDSGLVHLTLQKDSLWEHKPLQAEPEKISALLNDNEGQLWLAMTGKIVRTTAPLLRFLHPSDASLQTRIHALYTAADGTVWIAEGNKIKHLKGSTENWQLINSYTFQGANLQDITTIHQDPDGILWIGTIGAGIIQLNPLNGNWQLLRGNPVIEKGHILSITGKEDNIWVSGLNGLTNYTRNKTGNDHSLWQFTNYNKQSGIGSDYVYQVYIDKKDRIWFATDGAGVSCKDGNKITNFKGQAGLSSTVIYGITEDSANNIYLNTLDAGIVKYDGKKFTPFYSITGNQSGSVSSIMVNAQNRMVVMHKKGIDLVDLSNGKARHWGKTNGIIQEQMNLNIIGKNPDGNIWIGTNDGLICLLQEQPRTPDKPKTVITGLSVFGNSIDTSATITFPYDDNNITIYFDGLYFSEPDQVQFQYQLSGYHKEWITSSDRQVNFPRLLPGKYKLFVRSSVNGRFDESDQAVIQFTITPPFWKTWWFIILSSAATVLLLYAIMSQRVRQLQKWDRLKQEKINAELQTLRAQVNPHFLFNSFNTLMGVIEDDPQQAIEYTSQLSSFYRNMLTYRETDLIPVGEEIKLLDTYVFLQQKRFGSGLQYKMQVPAEKHYPYSIPPMTLQLLAENALKHNAVSADKPLTLSVYTEEGNLVVSNSINRKREPEKGEGVGLKNIIHRYALFSETPVSIEENEQSFTVKLPLIKINNHAHPDH